MHRTHDDKTCGVWVVHPLLNLLCSISQFLKQDFAKYLTISSPSVKHVWELKEVISNNRRYVMLHNMYHSGIVIPFSLPHIRIQFSTNSLQPFNDTLTLSWPAGHIHPTYKESFQVRWDNSIPLFLHAAIYLEVSLFRWTSQNAFSHKTAMYKWYCVQCCMQHCTQYHLYTAVLWENAFWLVQRNRDTSRYMAAWRKSGILLSQRTWKDSL